MFGKVNSVHINLAPEVGSFRAHGVARYERSFFAELARQNNYEMQCNLVQRKGKVGDDRLSSVMAVYVKRHDTPFMSFESFQNLPGLHSIYGDYEVIEIKAQVLNYIHYFKVNFTAVTSEQAAEWYCSEVLEKRYMFESHHQCVGELTIIIEAHKIESTIRD